MCPQNLVLHLTKLTRDRAAVGQSIRVHAVRLVHLQTRHEERGVAIAHNEVIDRDVHLGLRVTVDLPSDPHVVLSGHQVRQRVRVRRERVLTVERDHVEHLRAVVNTLGVRRVDRHRVVTRTVLPGRRELNRNVVVTLRVEARARQNRVRPHIALRTEALRVAVGTKEARVVRLPA